MMTPADPLLIGSWVGRSRPCGASAQPIYFNFRNDSMPEPLDQLRADAESLERSDRLPGGAKNSNIAATYNALQYGRPSHERGEVATSNQGLMPAAFHLIG